MTGVMQAWLRAGEPAIVGDLALLPRPSEGNVSSHLRSASDHAMYRLVDKNDQNWILKKFLPEWQEEVEGTAAICDLIPRMPCFKSGYERRVLDESSLSAAGYYTEELRAWLCGAVLVPEITVQSWATVVDSIKAGGQSLSRVVRLLLCQKLSESIGWLESVGVAHRNLSGTSVLIDSLNLEVHLIDWDHAYHASLSKPENLASGADGYIAPLVKINGITNTDATWKPKADRFALAVLNSEILLMKADSPVFPGGGLLEQQDIFDLAGQTLSRLRNALQQSSPEAVKLLDECLIAPNFDQCPGPTEWLNVIERELNNDAEKAWDEPRAVVEETRSIYDRPHESGFGSINESAFVKVNWDAFVSAPRTRRRR